jgi:TM2 domain-containing membrane protein YozV
MERIWLILTFVAVYASLGFGQTGIVRDSAGSAEQYAESSGIKDSLKAKKPSAAYSPAIALTSSILVPGAGQMYTRHYVKAGLFVLAEAGVGLFGYQQYIWEKGLRHSADSVSDLAARYAGVSVISVIDTAHADTTYPGIAFQLEADRDRFDALETRYMLYQSVSWMAGIYYYNILDALHATGIFKDDSKRDPGLAGWLAAVPALGLGQFYNGEISKAGMIFMTQFNLGLLAYNYHRLMRTCEDHVVAAGRDSLTYATFTSKGFGDDWENRRKNAFRNRNMYLWYSLLFYFYGMLDAVVDAHLHDAGVKMKLEPDLVPQNRQVGLTLTVPF